MRRKQGCKGRAIKKEGAAFSCSKTEKGGIHFNKLPNIERLPNGSLPHMTPKQRQMAVKLIRNICCNYDNGNCIVLDDGDACVCVQSISYSVNCKFFRHVLLESKEGLSLKAEIFHDDTTKRCTVCSKAFQSKSNNAKYCGKCAEEVKKKQKAAYARKRRAGVEK
ncbi:MAG TPA: conjugal transfer protein [Clostridiales bacterium]|nr:conjugal transfer protein [Clostridiales bacterium]